jgi:hypothetical protein
MERVFKNHTDATGVHRSAISASVEFIARARICA